MTAIQTAHLNSLTLKWLGKQSPALIGLMREHYAEFLKIPVDQTKSQFTSNEELAWVFAQFGSEIRQLAFDGKLIAEDRT